MTRPAGIEMDWKYKTGVSQNRVTERVRQRYADLRTFEGKQLQSIMDSIEADLPTEGMTGAQRLVLANLRGKLIINLQIAKYIENLVSIIDDKGNLPPCVGDFVKISDSTRRDLEALHSLDRKKGPRGDYLSFDQILAGDVDPKPKKRGRKPKAKKGV